MDPIHFQIPVPASTKNSRRILRHGRRTIVAKSAAAMASIRQIKRAAADALHQRGLRPPSDIIEGKSLLGDDDIAVDITHLVTEDRVHVVVKSVGQRPKGKTGRKRDLQNLQEGILDALQGILFDNDNQIVELRMRRIP